MSHGETTRRAAGLSTLSFARKCCVNLMFHTEIIYFLAAKHFSRGARLI